MKKSIVLPVFLLILIIFSCNRDTKNRPKVKTDVNGIAILSDQEIENIVKRSYQYVAMYNVNQKLALEETGMTTKGYNKGLKNSRAASLSP